MSASLQTTGMLDSVESNQMPNSMVEHEESTDNMENNVIEHHTSGQVRSTGRNILNYINSGPMSEGHVRLFNNDPRPSDPSQNLCLFTPCLFVVGFTILSIGVMLYVQHKHVMVGIFMVIFGSFSAGSAMLYTLIYIVMFGLRQTRSTQETTNRSSARKSLTYTTDGANGSANGSEFDQFRDFEEAKQTNPVQNDSIDFVNEGSGLCGSNYVPSTSETVQLNVDNLDFEIKSTQNLDVTVWRTANGDLPQSYLESFGDMPKDLLSSPSLKKALEGYGDSSEKPHLSKKNKKRGIFDSLRNGQPFSIKTHGKSGSQTELLDSENEGENTLFHVESIGKDLEPQASTSYQTKDANEEVTLVENAAGNSSIVVHFNRKNNDNVDSLIDTFH